MQPFNPSMRFYKTGPSIGRWGPQAALSKSGGDVLQLKKYKAITSYREGVPREQCFTKTLLNDLI
jgi:hypothetical protein